MADLPRGARCGSANGYRRNTLAERKLMLSLLPAGSSSCNQAHTHQKGSHRLLSALGVQAEWNPEGVPRQQPGFARRGSYQATDDDIGVPYEREVMRSYSRNPDRAKADAILRDSRGPSFSRRDSAATVKVHEGATAHHAIRLPMPIGRIMPITHPFQDISAHVVQFDSRRLLR